MTEILQYRPDSEDLENLCRGYVMANRINDIVAKPTSKRYRNYLELVQSQRLDRFAVDPDDAYRHKELLPRALDAYATRHGVEPVRGLLYCMADYRIAAAPDAIDGQLGLTVRCRQRLDTYTDAVHAGVTKDMERRAQAMMWVTKLKFWVTCDYFQDAETRTRKLYEHDLYADDRHMQQIGDAMVGFYQKTLLRAAREV